MQFVKLGRLSLLCKRYTTTVSNKQYIIHNLWETYKNKYYFSKSIVTCIALSSPGDFRKCITKNFKLFGWRLITMKLKFHAVDL